MESVSLLVKYDGLQSKVGLESSNTSL